jgi:hypothetical protein
MHDHWSHQWHGLYVHGDSDERVGYWCGFDCVCFSHAVDGSWCTNVGFSDQ